MVYCLLSSIASAETLDIPLENIEEHLNNLKDSFKVDWAGLRVRMIWSEPDTLKHDPDLCTKYFDIFIKCG